MNYYKSKNELIQDGTYKRFLAKRKELYFLDRSHNDDSMYWDEFGAFDTLTLFRIYNSQRQRKKRYRKEMCKWYFAITQTKMYQNYKMVFITFTFTDEDFKRQSEITRRRYVQRFLNENTVHYIANIDYSEIEREHYHAIAFIDKNINLRKWKNRINVKTIKITKNDIKATYDYVMKINNHAFKESTRCKSIIADKNTRDKLDYFLENVWYEEYQRFVILFNSYTENLYE